MEPELTESDLTPDSEQNEPKELEPEATEPDPMPEQKTPEPDAETEQNPDPPDASPNEEDFQTPVAEPGQEVSDQTPAPDIQPAPKPDSEPNVSPETAPSLDTDPTFSSPDNLAAVSDEAPEQPTEKTGLTPFSQTVLAAAGIGACAAAGFAVTHKGIFRKKKK